MLTKLYDSPALIKDVDPKKGIVAGYFANFGNKDSDGDIIVPGAFSKTILENGPESARPRIKHLLDHRRDQAIGKLLVLRQDTKGLYYESQIADHDLGRNFLKMCEGGLITEHSIGYRVIKGNPTDDGYQLLELALMEGSSLQFWGANPDTPLTGMKALKTPEELIDAAHLLEKAIRGGTFTDETFLLLEARFKALAELLAERRPTDRRPTEHKSTTEPGDVPTQPDASAIYAAFAQTLKV